MLGPADGADEDTLSSMANTIRGHEGPRVCGGLQYHYETVDRDGICASVAALEHHLAARILSLAPGLPWRLRDGCPVLSGIGRSTAGKIMTAMAAGRRAVPRVMLTPVTGGLPGLKLGRIRLNLSILFYPRAVPSQQVGNVFLRWSGQHIGDRQRQKYALWIYRGSVCGAMM